MDKDFNLALDKHLKREELLFRAKHCPKGSRVDWLAPSCESLDDIVGTLRWLGFRIKETVECDGAEWVETTGGVLVFVNSGDIRGLVCGRDY